MAVRTEMITLTPGEYLVGDPCYLFGHDKVDSKRWMDLLRSCDYFKKPHGVVDDAWIIAFGTAYGDGYYPDNEGRMYAVDAGLIGITPAKFFPEDKNSQYAMHRITFDEPFNVWEDEGTIHFGEVAISTGDDDDDDDGYISLLNSFVEED